MNIELVTIGTELLLGFTVDTNGAEIARALAVVGVRIVRRTSVPDDGAAIRDAVTAALARTGAVLTTGGLGPTRDDISKKVLADLYGAPLEFDEAIWNSLLERFRRLNRTPVASNRSQAEVPRGATVLPNRWGTAPGIWLEGAPVIVFMLPGVPLEMRMLLANEVVPRLIGRAAGAGVIRSRTVRTTAIPESTLAERLGDIDDPIAPLSLAYLPGLDGVDLRVTAWNLAPDEADARLAAAVAALRERAGAHVYAEGETTLAEVVLAEARRRGLTIAAAESCTGGLFGARLTEVPGSSDVFLGGVITYADAAKSELAGVDPAVIAQHGAVSEPVARAMALGVARRLAADLAVGITGIAGPTGGSAEKPVGTVWLAVYDRGETVARRVQLFNTRAEIRARAVQTALYRLWQRIIGA